MEVAYFVDLDRREGDLERRQVLLTVYYKALFLRA